MKYYKLYIVKKNKHNFKLVYSNKDRGRTQKIDAIM